MEEKTKKKIGIAPIIATVVAILAVIGVVAFLIFSGSLNLGGLFSLKTEKAKEYVYENTSKLSRAAVGKGFAVLTGSELRSFNERGEETFLTFIVYDDPVLTANGNHAVAFDAGGKSFIVFTDHGETFRAETDSAITSVFVNDEGYVTAATEEPGYGGSITVYNPNGRALYKWYSGANYVVSGKIRERTELLTLSIGKTGSELDLFRINDEAEQGKYNYSGVILDADFNGSGITAVTPEKLILLNRSLTERNVFDYEGKHLDGYVIGDYFTLLVLSDYAVGGERVLILIDVDGKEASRLTVSDLEGYGLYDKTVVALSGGRLDFYNTRFERVTSADNIGYCEELFLRDEKTVILCGDYSARVVTVG